MLLEEELARFTSEKDMLLTIGVFDGVHLGHKYLIGKLVALAKQQNRLSGVVTFLQHPREVLSPSLRLPRLTDPAQKVSLLKNEGVDAVIALAFIPRMAELSARQFLGLLQKYLRMRGLVVGPDFALGRNREGNINFLRKLGEEMEFSVTVVLPKKMNGMVVSSTAIREAMAGGDITKVNKLLGRPFSLQGRVVSGAHRGGPLLGFPTFNLEVDSNQALPPDGVYATRTYIDDKVYPSMTNIGRRPTFGENERTIETFILDYKGNLYERHLKIVLIERLRDEKKFDSAEELKQQIAEDVKTGRAILASPEYAANR
ncbi:MAG: bifunctional riboflavin kinase/FAD synthetase [Dehalococcoidales bacterium]|nr:bifunctional riboflavin kinase/FAD synthetase [Dehalococcoidales bacterium]